MFKDKIRKNKTYFFIKKIQVNLSQLTKLLMQVIQVIEFNKFFIPQISFHLIDLHDNKTNVIFSNETFFLKEKKMTSSWN